MISEHIKRNFKVIMYLVIF